MASEDLPPSIFGTWIHSGEEDSGDEIVFRPAGYPLPPSRGRAGIELRPDGEFVDLQIAPTDARRAVDGRWQLEEPGRLRVSFAEGSRQPETVDIVEVGDDVLKLRRRPAD